VADLIRITHPKLPPAAPANTTQRAFDRVWSKKGWQVVSDEPAKSAAKPSKES
jgi:hypothetical protein